MQDYGFRLGSIGGNVNASIGAKNLFMENGTLVDETTGLFPGFDKGASNGLGNGLMYYLGGKVQGAAGVEGNAYWRGAMQTLFGYNGNAAATSAGATIDEVPGP